MTEGKAGEKAAIRILIDGLPSSPGGVGPVIRLLEKRRLIKEKWEDRKAKREKKNEKPGDDPAA